MLLRLSTKLAARLKLIPTGVRPLDPCPLADWSAHLFNAERKEFVIVTNTASLYCVLFHAREIPTAAEFVSVALASIQDFLAHDGLAPLYERYLAPAGEDIRFSKALNRSVTGSMNDLITHAKFFLTERTLSPHETAARLNDIPFSSLDYRKPREVFVALATSWNNEA